MKIKASKTDIIWSYIGTLFSLSSGFILLPFILIFLNSNEVGLWYIFLSINGLVNLFDFGFDPTFARNIAYAWSGATEISKTGAKFTKESKRVNYRLLKILITASKNLYRIISLLAFFFVATVGTVYMVHISKGLSGYNHIIAWVIFCISLFLNLYMGYFSALLRGVGAVAIINRATIFSKLSQLIVSVLLLAMGFGLISVAVGFLANGFVLRYLYRYGFYNYRNMEEHLNSVKEPLMKTDIKKAMHIVSYNAFRDGLVALSNYLTTQASSIMASLFFTLGQTGIYSISLQFANAVSSVSASMIYAYHPTLQSAYVNKDSETERNIIARGLSVLYFLSILGTIAVIVFIFPILHIIKPDTNFSIPIFLGLSLYTLLWQQQSSSASYISNTNQVPYMPAFVISSILGIILTLLAIKFTDIGIWSLIIGPLVAQGIYNNWKWTHVVMSRLDTTLSRTIKSGFQYWIQVLLNKLKNKRGDI